MPIRIGHKVSLAERLGNPLLRDHQAEFLFKQFEWGKQHYLTHYLDDYGNVKCPGGDRNGPCLCQFGTGLWFPPGKGKTFTALWYEKLVRDFMVSQQDKRADWPVLIWTTTSAKWQWAAIEIPKWRPDLRGGGKVLVIDGDQMGRDAQLEMLAALKPRIVIMHHAQIGVTVKGVFEFAQEVDWLALFSDEDQHFKNWSSGRTKRKNAIKRGFELSITGTPQSGYVDKLHAILHGIRPGQHHEYHLPICRPGAQCPLPEYTRRAYLQSCRGCFNHLPEFNICKVNGHQPDEDLGIKYQYSPGMFGSFKKFCELYLGNPGSQAEENLHKLIYGNFVAHRITSKFNGEIIPIAIPMSDDQWELYEVITAGLRKYFDENMEEAIRRGTTFILAQFTHLRRVTTLSPAAFMLAYGKHPIRANINLPKLSGAGDSSKIQWALGFIQDNVSDTRNKMIVGSEWDDVIQEIAGKLERNGFKEAEVGLVAGNDQTDMTLSFRAGEGEYYAVISGDVPAKQRTAIQMAFNTDSRLKVLLMTPAGYEALNLTGGLNKGDTMYIACLGVPFLPDKIIQLFGRADREDMEGDIVAYIPACQGTMDERVHSILYGKQTSADKVIDGNFTEDTVANKLSLHEAVGIYDLLKYDRPQRS